MPRFPLDPPENDRLLLEFEDAFELLLDDEFELAFEDLLELELDELLELEFDEELELELDELLELEFDEPLELEFDEELPAVCQIGDVIVLGATISARPLGASTVRWLSIGCPPVSSLGPTAATAPTAVERLSAEARDEIVKVFFMSCSNVNEDMPHALDAVGGAERARWDYIPDGAASHRPDGIARTDRQLTTVLRQ